MGKMFYGPEAPEASFNGSWSNGVRSGLGILTFKNGDRFEGHWRDSQKEGPGRYFYKATNQVIITVEHLLNGERRVFNIDCTIAS
jgi:hypothetical protein